MTSDYAKGLKKNFNFIFQSGVSYLFALNRPFQ